MVTKMRFANTMNMQGNLINANTQDPPLFAHTKQRIEYFKT